jgi:hypothetical protein
LRPLFVRDMCRRLFLPPGTGNSAFSFPSSFPRPPLPPGDNACRDASYDAPSW